MSDRDETLRGLARAWKARAKMYRRKLDWCAEHRSAEGNLAAALTHAAHASARLEAAIAEVRSLSSPQTPPHTEGER